MANRLYNKQVSPKGYKKGGSVRDTRKTEQMIGASISSKREKGRTRKMGGGMMMERPMMQKGGSLKPVQPNQKGLKKLPTKVRNKMGYMKDGGKVKNKKSIIQSIIDIPKTIKADNDALRKANKKMDKEKRFKNKMRKASSKAFSESLKDPRKLERLDDKIKEDAKKVKMMRVSGQI